MASLVSSTSIDPAFPCSITLDLPLPTSRLASTALKALSVDAELSPLVRREFTLVALPEAAVGSGLKEEDKTVLRATYKATTNRMLRVSFNGFMESLGTVIGVMAELDVDVLESEMEIKQTNGEKTT